MDLSRRLAMFPAILSLIAGCTAHAALPSGAIHVPTDDTVVPIGGTRVLCTLSAAVPSVAGTFVGDPMDPAWPVWLVAEDGRRLYVLWPRDFSVRFDPEATLLDESGAIVVHAGSPVELGQVSADPTKGTRDRPYVADGLWATGMGRALHCYHHES